MIDPEKLLEELQITKTKKFTEDAIEPIRNALLDGNPVLAIGLIGGWLTANSGNLQFGPIDPEANTDGKGDPIDSELMYEDYVSVSIYDAFAKLKKKVRKIRKNHSELMTDAACEFYFNAEEDDHE